LFVGSSSIATAAGRILADGAKVVVAGGCESISLVQNVLNVHNFTDEWTLRHEPDIYMPMLQTADAVATHYNISREAQDAYAFQSQQRTAAAQAAGKFDAEIVPLPAWKFVEHKEDGTFSEEAVTLTKDEGNRADTDPRGSRRAQGVLGKNSTITAGNSSQLSDGAGAVVVMDGKEAARRNLQPLGIYRGLVVRAASRARWDRAGLRYSRLATAARTDRGRHRPLGTQRSVRRPDRLLPRHAGIPNDASMSTAARSRSATHMASAVPA